MIGEIHDISIQYYDRTLKAMSIKTRPALVVGQADLTDYVVLPISTIKDASKRDSYYDIRIELANFPKSGLTAMESFIRTHKPQTVHYSQIRRRARSNFRLEYTAKYDEVILRAKEFYEKAIK